MDVDQGKGMSRGKKGRFRTGKGKHRGKNKGKSKETRPGPCLLCQGPHWARDCPSHHGGKGKTYCIIWQGTQELLTVSTCLSGR